MLLTFFVDSLSNPLFIVTICVPKRSVKMICVDYQIFTFCVPKDDGVENEERMWKHSPKRWRNVSAVFSTDFTMCVPKHKISQRFLAKNFVDSIIIVTFAVSYPCWKLQLGKGGVDIYT